MRLTHELVSVAPQCLNPAQFRQISFRGAKIPTIENLGATKDSFECFDLCDNDILRLENFPVLKRLKCILCANNRISRIADNVGECLPNLTSLILTNNRIELREDLEPLKKVKSLERVSFVGNPVSSAKYYRLYLISILPNVRFIDFQRVTKSERDAAAAIFGGEEGASILEEIAKERATISAKPPAPSVTAQQPVNAKTPQPAAPQAPPSTDDPVGDIVPPPPPTDTSTDGGLVQDSHNETAAAGIVPPPPPPPPPHAAAAVIPAPPSSATATVEDEDGVMSETVKDKVADAEGTTATSAVDGNTLAADVLSDTATSSAAVNEESTGSEDVKMSDGGN
eukprot:Lankesteria_metandrocarpae@DN984_c0_g1_i1.p1